MEKPSREEHVRRLQALIEDALDQVAGQNPDGFDLGVIALNLEVLHETPLSDFLKRSDAGYTPDDDVGSYFTYWCSDHRSYIQAAIFRDAYNYAQELEYRRSQPSDDAPEDDDDNDNNDADDDA
jgi:hypothetical protein